MRLGYVEAAGGLDQAARADKFDWIFEKHYRRGELRKRERERDEVYEVGIAVPCGRGPLTD